MADGVVVVSLVRQLGGALVLLYWLGGVVASLAAPADYYSPAQGKAGQPLRDALHQIIRNHTVIPYASSTKLDTSDALRVLDRDPANASNVWLAYAQRSESTNTFGWVTGWNREHRWPDSYGLFNTEPAYSDLHNMHAEDASVNSERGNKYFDESDPADGEYRNPAHFEAPQCSSDTNSWAPPPAVRGDIARSLFYMAIRYTGDTLGEPNLRLTGETNRIATGASYMGRLSTLLAWHRADPPDDAERARNDLIDALYQHNRNPFVDHPEWVDLTFAPACTNAPQLRFEPVAGGVQLSWVATNQFCQLEITGGLAGTWQPVETVPILSNGWFHLTWTNPPPHDGMYFRLRAEP